MKKILLFAFFENLKNENIKLFYCLLFYSIIQLCATFIKLEMTPINLYGMYSEKIPYKESFTYRKIYLDNKYLNDYNISFRELDLLYTDLENYLIARDNNFLDPFKIRVESKYHFITKSFLYPLLKNKVFNKKEAYMLFPQWFKQKCSNLIGRKINFVYVVDFTYKFNISNFKIDTIQSETIAIF